MRVLHVTTPARFGGLERVVSLLAERQRGLGDDVHVASLSADRDAEPFFDALALRGITVHPGTANGRNYLRQRNDLERLLRTLRPEVVHTHGYRADILAAGAAGRSGCAVLTTLHGFTGGDLKIRCYEWLQRRMLRRLDGVVAVSASMARDLISAGLPADRVRVIPNVLPAPGPRLHRSVARRTLGVAPTRYTVGWVGRLSHEKGLDLLLESLALCGDPGIALAVIGDGPERQRLEHQAELLGLGGQVTWCGAIQGADRYLTAFDLFAMSSRTEGSPLVLLEAMAAGVPIVATVVGGVPETISPALAVLVPPEDPAALAAGIAKVRSDPSSAARRSLRAHVRVARLSDPDRWAATYGDAYGAAIHRRKVLQ